jgi:putative endonuclease
MRSRAGTAAQARGVGAESRVCRILQRDGWSVLLRRARTPCGEIDIVAESPDAALIAFIEVKARSTFGDAAHALSAEQRARLLGAAEILLDRNPHWAGHNLRFDLILLDAEGRMRRIADAFRIGDA